MIKVKNILGKGRGVVAKQIIPTGTLLEIAPVGIFPAEQRPIINKTEVFAYYFVQPVEYTKSKNAKGYLVFGLASLCNHQKEPNSRIDWIEDEVGLWSYLVSQKEILPGEEVTVFYTNIEEYSDDNFI